MTIRAYKGIIRTSRWGKVSSKCSLKVLFGEFWFSTAENHKKREVLERMLIGTYEHNLDGKNRVFVPAKFREELGENFCYNFCGSQYPSIRLYNRQTFEQTLSRALEERKEYETEREIKAKHFLGAGEASYDSQGRVIFSQLITKYAHIEKQCIFVGFGDYVEVMSPESYNKYLETIILDSVLDEEAADSEKKIRRSYRAEGKLLGL